jgi:hypothetical protein
MGKKRACPDYMAGATPTKRQRYHDGPAENERDDPHFHDIPVQGEDVYSPDVDTSEFGNLTEDEEEQGHVRYPLLKNALRHSDFRSDVSSEREVEDGQLSAPTDNVRSPQQLRAERRAAERRDDGVGYTDDEQGEEPRGDEDSLSAQEDTDDQEGYEPHSAGHPFTAHEYTDPLTRDDYELYCSGDSLPDLEDTDDDIGEQEDTDDRNGQPLGGRLSLRKQLMDVLSGTGLSGWDLSAILEEGTGDGGSQGTTRISRSVPSPSSSPPSSLPSLPPPPPSVSPSSLPLTSPSSSSSSLGSFSSLLLAGDPELDVFGEVLRYAARTVHFVARAEAHGIDVSSFDSLAQVSRETWKKLHVRPSTDEKARDEEALYAKTMLETIMRLEVRELGLIVEKAEKLDEELLRLGISI